MNSVHRWLSGRCCAENRANGPSATGPPSPTAFISTYYALGTAPCAQPGRLSQHLSEPTCPEDEEVASRRRLFGNFPQLSSRDAEGKKHQLCAVLPSDERPFLWSCPVSVSPLGCQQQFDEVTGALLGLTCFSSPSPACAPSAPREAQPGGPHFTSKPGTLARKPGLQPLRTAGAPDPERGNGRAFLGLSQRKCQR